MKLKILICRQIIILKLGKLTYMGEKRRAVIYSICYVRNVCMYCSFVNILKMLITLEKTERVDC